MRRIRSLTDRCLGIYIKCLRDPIDTSDGSAAAKAQLQMSLVFAEWQRNTTRVRIVAGQKKARAQGRTPGRKSALSPSQQDAVHHTRSMTRLLCHGIGASAKPRVNLFSPTERKFTHARTQSFAQTAQPHLYGN
ncbi:MAG: recombinase family protein [Chloroflexi bacterium]|nr:recombinase family protein [Chloroflexota bacterium]